MSIKWLFCIPIFLVIYSCSTDSTSSNYIETVPVFNAQEHFLPNIEADSTTNSELGPSPLEPYAITAAQKERIPVVAITLGPGINRVFGHISLLKSLKESTITLHYLSGTGLAAIIAAMYAADMTPDKIEWVFYTFFNEAKEYPPYSPKWLDSLKSILNKVFADKMIEDLNHTLFLPLYNREAHLIEYPRTGHLVTALMNNLQLLPNNRKLKYSSAFTHQIYGTSTLKKNGANIIVNIDVLGQGIFFDSKHDFLYNIFSEISAIIGREKETLDMFFELPISKMPLDSLKELPLYLQLSAEESKLIIQSVKNKIEQWQRGTK